MSSSSPHSSASEDEGTASADAAKSSADVAALQRRRERRRLSMRRYRLRQRRQAEEVAAAIQSLTFERDQLHLQLLTKCGEVLGSMVFNYVQQSAVEFVEQRVASAAAAAAANPSLPVRRAENAQQKRRTALAFEVSSLKLFLQGGGLGFPPTLPGAPATSTMPGPLPNSAAVAAAMAQAQAQPGAGMPGMTLPMGMMSSMMPGMSAMGIPSIGAMLGPASAPQTQQSPSQHQPQQQQTQPQPPPQSHTAHAAAAPAVGAMPEGSNPAFKWSQYMGMPMPMQMQMHMSGLAPLGLAGLAGFGAGPSSIQSQPGGLVPVQPGSGFPAPGSFSSMLPPAAAAAAAASAGKLTMDLTAPPPAASPATSASAIMSGVSMSSTPSPMMVPSAVVCPAPRYLDGRSAFARPRMPMAGPPMTTYSQMRPGTMAGGAGTTTSSDQPVSVPTVSSSTGLPATATVSYPMSVWGPVFN